MRKHIKEDMLGRIGDWHAGTNAQFDKAVDVLAKSYIGYHGDPEMDERDMRDDVENYVETEWQYVLDDSLLNAIYDMKDASSVVGKNMYGGGGFEFLRELEKAVADSVVTQLKGNNTQSPMNEKKKITEAQIRRIIREALCELGEPTSLDDIEGKLAPYNATLVRAYCDFDPNGQNNSLCVRLPLDTDTNALDQLMADMGFKRYTVTAGTRGYRILWYKSNAQGGMLNEEVMQFMSKLDDINWDLKKYDAAVDKERTRYIPEKRVENISIIARKAPDIERTIDSIMMKHGYRRMPGGGGRPGFLFLNYIPERKIRQAIAESIDKVLKEYQHVITNEYGEPMGTEEIDPYMEDILDVERREAMDDGYPEFFDPGDDEAFGLEESRLRKVADRCVRKTLNEMISRSRFNAMHDKWLDHGNPADDGSDYVTEEDFMENCLDQIDGDPQMKADFITWIQDCGPEISRMVGTDAPAHEAIEKGVFSWDEIVEEFLMKKAVKEQPEP